MMKKITRIAALLATTAFMLAGFPACGDDDGDEEPTLEKIEIGIAESVKFEYDINEEFDKTGITVTATYSDGSTKDVTDKATFTATTSEGEFTTATAGKHNVTLTATYEGKTDTATREITVKSDNPANDDKEDNSDGEDDGSDNNDSDNSGNEEGNESGNESGNENGNDNSGNSDSDTEEGNGNESGNETGNDDNSNEPYVLNVKFSANEEIQGEDKVIDDVVTIRSTATDSKGTTYQKIKFNKNGYIEMGGAQAKPNYGLEITFAKAATVKTKVTKKSGGKATKAVLVKTEFGEDGKTPIVVAETDGIDEYDANNTADTVTERTIEVTEPGTYVFGADTNGCFVYSLVINWKD